MFLYVRGPFIFFLARGLSNVEAGHGLDIALCCCIRIQGIVTFNFFEFVFLFSHKMNRDQFLI